MSTFRKAFIATIVRSLLRGKSLLQAIIGFWLNPLSMMRPNGKNVDGEPSMSLQQFIKDAEAEFLDRVHGEALVDLSSKFKKQFLDALAQDLPCMLPSYSHQLPKGIESGRFLALDVGGSTLRVAVIELRKDEDSTLNASEIISIQSFPIGREVKDLVGIAFFEWMGAKIAETLANTSGCENSAEKPLPVALAWSFPIEQTSLGGGMLQPMGKGFLADVGLVGQDLGDIIRRACESQELHVELRAILNDSSACLLSRAYSHTSTRFGLILGTGFNVAVYLPVTSIARSKFGERPAGWFEKASHVIVNTELSMFGGGGILPLTRWDEQLLKEHPRPDFQPLEHMVSGMYLGEIARFALIEAINTTGLLGGVVPPSLKGGYSLGTDLLSMIEGDSSKDLAKSIELFSTRHPSSHVPTISDLEAIRSIASFISVRASALVATAVFSLWDLRLEGERELLATLPEDSARRQAAEEDLKLETTTVAFNGSVIENYPGYRSNCQRYMRELIASKGLPEARSIQLVAAKESSLTGAAVALACTREED